MFGFLFTLMLSVWNGEMYRAYGCAQFESKNLFLQACKRATLLFWIGPLNTDTYSNTLNFQLLKNVFAGSYERIGNVWFLMWGNNFHLHIYVKLNVNKLVQW